MAQMGGGAGFDRWGPDRLPSLTALLTGTLPDEALTSDELLACCWDDPDPAVVLGATSGAAVGAGVVRAANGHRIGHVRLLVVASECRRQGLGRATLAALEGWFAEQGASEVRVGGEAPFYLWPGIDVRHTAALSLLEGAGYAGSGAICNMACPSSFRQPAPAGVEVRRVLTDDDASLASDMVRRTWPEWGPEVGRSIEHGSCVAAWEDNMVLGFGCHSVNRGGWIGPIGTVPAAQGRGVGGAVLGALCADLTAAGYRRAEISWIGPVGFYARTADAHVSRVFQTRSRQLS